MADTPTLKEQAQRHWAFYMGGALSVLVDHVLATPWWVVPVACAAIALVGLVGYAVRDAARTVKAGRTHG